MSEADVERRLRALERMVDNGRFLRRDVFDVVLRDVRDDFGRIETALADIRSGMKADREAREADRKGIRNLILGALFTGGVSLAASFVLWATLAQAPA
jgi:hypothetical protein